MEILWTATLFSIFVVVVEGICSYTEKTFAPFQKDAKKIKLYFIYHGGVVVGDLIILSYLFGIWLPHIHIPMWAVLIFVVVSTWITMACHKAWWFMCKDQPGFMYPDRFMSGGVEKYWSDDLPRSAWIHVFYMIGSIVMIGGYIFSSMPPEIVWRTFWLMLVFVPIAIIEPGIVQGWAPTKKDIINSVGVAIVLWAVVGIVTWLKLIHWWIL